MKKTAAILVSILFFFSSMYFVPTNVRSQEFDFAKSYQDYIYSLTVYDGAFSDYEKAKDSYLKNPTLTLKEEARKKTLTMLRSREELFRVYLSSLRMKLIEIKTNVPSKLDEEIAWYQARKDAYQDQTTLEELFKKSNESAERYTAKSSYVIYESLFNISFGELTNLKSRQESVYKSIRNSIDQGVAAGILKLDPFNRWFTDIENVLKEIDLVNSKAKTKLAKMFEGNQAPKAAYTSAISELESNTTLQKSLSSFLTELLNSVNARLNQ